MLSFCATLYNILIRFAVHIKMVRLINMCLNEMYSRVKMGKHLSDMLPIKNVLKQLGALSPLLFRFTVDYVIRKVQVNHNSLDGPDRWSTYFDEQKNLENLLPLL